MSKTRSFLGFVIVAMSFMFAGSCLAQEVESKKYDCMLSRRLPTGAPFISVSEIDTTDEEIVYLDTREREEYDVSHIENARYTGYKDADLDKVMSLPRSTEIVVYCSVGYRSGKIAEDLIEKGFTNVKNLYGGIFEWSNQEMPLVDAEGKSTQKIHPYNKRWGRWITHGDKSYE